MTGGAGTVDDGGPVEPARQAELPRRVPRASPEADRASPGTEHSPARAAGAGTAGTGPAGPRSPSAAGPGPQTPGPQTPGPQTPGPGTLGPGIGAAETTGTRFRGPWTPRIRPAAAGAAGTGPLTPGTAPGTPQAGPAQTGPDPAQTGPGPTGTGRPGTDRTGTGPAGTAPTESTAPGPPWTGTPAPRTSKPAGSGPGSTGGGGSAGSAGPGGRGTGSGGPGTGATRAAGRASGQDRAAIRPAPGHALPRRAGSGRAAKGSAPGKGARGRSRPPADAARGAAAEPTRPAEANAARLPWYEVAHARRAAEGYQNCGPLERVLRREWPPSKVPSPPVVRAVNRLAELPHMIKEILAAGVDAIHVGEGGVPELDDMARLRGVPLPSGRATWDACAGAYGERKIIVGSRPSSAPDVMCHEVGHALDDIDREQGRWQSDSDEFRHLYQRCEGSLVSDFHRQPGDLGRREFFADAFAAIASRQRPALVDMLGGNIRTALDVMLYFNLRYGL
jgi:hypothetical protein